MRDSPVVAYWTRTRGGWESNPVQVKIVFLVHAAVV